MIINTNTGVLIAGTLAKDPELRHVGQYGRAVLKMSVRYGTEKDEQGKSHGKFLDVDIWDSAEELDGMFAKDDAVIVAGGELKSREYNSKTYHSISATGIFPSAGVVFRWMQQVIDMIPAAPPVPMNPPAGFGPASDQSGDHIPGVTKMVADEAPGTDFIAGEPEDLPF